MLILLLHTAGRHLLVESSVRSSGLLWQWQPHPWCSYDATVVSGRLGSEDMGMHVRLGRFIMSVTSLRVIHLKSDPQTAQSNSKCLVSPRLGQVSSLYMRAQLLVLVGSERTRRRLCRRLGGGGKHGQGDFAC